MNNILKLSKINNLKFKKNQLGGSKNTIGGSKHIIGGSTSTVDGKQSIIDGINGINLSDLDIIDEDINLQNNLVELQQKAIDKNKDIELLKNKELEMENQKKIQDDYIKNLTYELYQQKHIYFEDKYKQLKKKIDNYKLTNEESVSLRKQLDEYKIKINNIKTEETSTEFLNKMKEYEASIISLNKIILGEINNYIKSNQQNQLKQLQEISELSNKQPTLYVRPGLSTKVTNEPQTVQIKEEPDTKENINTSKQPPASPIKKKETPATPTKQLPATPKKTKDKKSTKQKGGLLFNLIKLSNSMR